MQRDNEKLDMPGGFKSSRDSTTFDGSDNSQHRATSSTSHETPSATAMRATNVNRDDGRFEVAGPTVGGSPTPYDSGNIESAKDSNNTTLARDTETGHARKSSLSETVIAGAATAASTAASTAAAAGASVLAAAKKLVSGEDSETHHDRHTDDHDRPFPGSSSTTSAATAHGDNQGLEFSHRAVGPNDRSPAKIDVRAMKPSSKATYGNLDSPGAHNMPGPLSDSTLMGTPPLPGGNQQKTFADPFGPVRVSNWNDGRHQADVSTPTSEDFDMHIGSPVIKSQPFTASSGASDSLGDNTHSHGTSQHAREPGHSPLREEIPSHHADTTPAANYRAPGHVDSITTSPSVDQNSRNLGTGAAIGAGAAAAGAGAASLAGRQKEHEHDHVPTTQSTTSANIPTTQSSTSANISPAPRVPADSKRIPIAQPPSSQHSVPNTAHNSSNIAPSAVVGGAAMGAAAAPLASHTASSAAHPQSATTAHSADKKETVIDKVKNIFHHDSSHAHHEIPKDSTHLFAASNAATLLAQQQYAEKHAGQVHQQPQPQQHSTATAGSHSSSTAPKVAAVTAVPMAAGATAASQHRPHTHGLPAHEGEVPVRHNTSTIATSSAAPEILANRTDYVPASQVHSYQQHHQHLPHEGNVQGQRDNLSTANVAAPTGAAAGLAGGVHSYQQHHQHLPHEGNVQGQRDNLSTANVAVPTGAAAGLAGGATGAKLASAAYMGNKSEMVAPRDISHENIVDKTLPPAPSQHTAYLPHGDGAAARTSDNRSHGSSVASTIGAAGLGAATGAGAAKAYQNHTTNTAATHDISHDNTTMGNVSGIDRTNVDQRAGKDTTGTVVNPVYADAPVVQNVSSTKVHDARPLTQKLVDKPPASANAGNSTKHGAGKAAATAAIASGTGFTAYLGSKESLNRHGVAHPEDHTAEHQQQYRPLTEKIRGAFGAPLYGPADPMDLPLTDPKTLLPLPTHAKIPAARTSPKSEALSAAAATTAGAAAGTAAYLGDKESRRTSGHHVGDQVPDHHQQRRRSLGEIIKETVGGHHYGPADPKDLPLTDPKTVRPLGSIASDTAATTAAGAATAAAVGAGAHHAHSKDTAKNDNTADSAMRTSVPVATSAGTVGSGIHAAQAKDDVKKYDTTMSSATPPSHSYKPSAANAAGPATAAATAGAGIHALRNKDDAKNYDTKPSSTAATSHTSAPVMNKTDQTETPHSTAPVATAGLTGAAAVPAAALGAHRPPATTSTANVGPTAYRENVQTDPTAHRENTPTGPTAYRENVQTGNRENVQTGNLNSNLGTRSQQMTDIGSNAAPPTDYHGQMPQAKPGEEVVWVKKITTTDYYDDENLDEPTGVIEDSNRDRADYHANVNTSNTDYGGKHQGGLRTDENVQQQQRQEQLEHGTQRPHHGGLVDRLLGRHHDEADKGKERL